MQFNRLALLDAVEKAIAEHRAAHDRKVAAWEALVAESKAKWHRDHGPAWLAAIQRIEQLLRDGDVVQSADYPSATWHEPYISGGQKPGAYPQPMALISLQRTLKAVADETITPSGLRALGCTPATLQSALAYLAPPEVPARAS